MTEEKHECKTYADMYAMLRKAKADGHTAWWNKEELMAGELIVYKTQTDAIIDGLLGNNNLTASPEVWYGLHQIKNLPATKIVRCGECVNFAERGFCKVAGHNVHRKSNCMQVFGAERRTDGA